MAAYGRIPMRDDEKVRPDHTQQKANRPPETRKGTLEPLDLDRFQPDPDWHITALHIWQGAMTSGQAKYYQNSDLAQLYLACNELSQALKAEGEWKTNRDGEEYYIPPRRSGQYLSSVFNLLNGLLLTEGDRRRARIELSDATAKQESKADQILASVTEMRAGLKKAK